MGNLFMVLLIILLSSLVESCSADPLRPNIQEKSPSPTISVTIVSTPDAQQIARQNARQVHIDRVKLASPDGSYFVAYEREVNAAIQLGLSRRDPSVLNEAIHSGSAFVVNDGQLVLVMNGDSGQNAAHVRLIGGPHDGETGWMSWRVLEVVFETPGPLSVIPRQGPT